MKRVLMKKTLFMPLSKAFTVTLFSLNDQLKPHNPEIVQFPITIFYRLDSNSIYYCIYYNYDTIKVQCRV
jgi:hypothetical protein